MSRRRYITTDISLDKDVTRMGIKYGDAPVLLYTWLIVHASDNATVDGDPFELLGLVWPNRRDKSEEDIISCLLQIDEFKLIAWDREESKIYFPIGPFYRVQSYINKDNRRTVDHPRLLSKSGERKTPEISEDQRETAENAGDQRGSAGNAVSLSLSPSLSLSKDQQQQQCAGAREVVSDPSPQPTDEPPARRDPDAFQAIHKCLEDSFGRLPSEFQVGTFVLYALDDGMEIDLIMRAIRQSALAQKDLRHADATLKSWRQKGILTNASAELEAEEFRMNKRPVEQVTRINQHSRASPSVQRVVPAVQAGKYDEFYRRYSELGIDLQGGGKPDG